MRRLLEVHKRWVWLFWVLGCVLWPAAGVNAEPEASRVLSVEIQGAVAHSGVQEVTQETRLSQVVLAADVLPTAYPLGAAWLRMTLTPVQAQTKTWLLTQLSEAGAKARADGNETEARALLDWMTRWESLPVTGRLSPVLLDPRPLEIAENNPLVMDGDQLIFPARPTTIRVRGALAADCTLPFVALQSARVYLNACPLDRIADKDWVYVIQPDGKVMREGVALWNREQGQALTPGAVVYVPLQMRWLPKAAQQSFNDRAAAFLATQVVGWPPASNSQ